MIVLKKSATDPDLQWFNEARLGMFVHFGVYALLARGEHVLQRENIPRAEYERLMHEFNPERFDAEQWIDVAEAMGARYITVTAKHLDGFCMFDSALTDYTITNSPFGRDLIGELVEACHRRDMRICLYYSRAEWHHRNYIHDPRARYSLAGPQPGQQPDWPRYMEFFLGQLRELCTNYGRIDGFWFDAYGPTYPGDPTPRDVYRMLKRYQPAAVINDRNEYGDFFTPERTLPEDLTGYLFEACQAVGTEWGYEEDVDLFSAPFLIRSLAHVVGHGGNFLLNIGPKADGSLPEDRVRRMRLLGDWVRRNREAVFGTESVPLVSPAGKAFRDRVAAAQFYAVQRGTEVFLLLPEWPQSDRIRVSNLTTLPKQALVLGYDGELTAEMTAHGLDIKGLPPYPPQQAVNVVKLCFEQTLRIKPPTPVPTPKLAVHPTRATVLLPQAAQREGRQRKGRLVQVCFEQDRAADAGGAAGAGSTAVLTGWWRPEQKARWPVTCTEETAVTVSVDLRCPQEQAGSELVVEAAGQQLSCTIAATPKGAFRTQKVGVLHLPPGASTVTLRPGRMVWPRHFADVRAVRLTP